MQFYVYDQCILCNTQYILNFCTQTRTLRYIHLNTLNICTLRYTHLNTYTHIRTLKRSLIHTHTRIYINLSPSLLFPDNYHFLDSLHVSTCQNLPPPTLLPHPFELHVHVRPTSRTHRHTHARTQMGRERKHVITPNAIFLLPIEIARLLRDIRTQELLVIARKRDIVNLTDTCRHSL